MRRPFALLVFALVIGTCVALLAWLQFATPEVMEPDGYFHIKLAWITRTQGLVRQFPWATMSIWRERYFDKELGFHLALIPFTYGDLAQGMKLATVVFGGVLFASFYAVLRLRRVGGAGLWTLGLFAAGAFFVFRAVLPRPHLLAIAFALWTTWAVLQQRRVTLFVLCVFYTLFYTAPHLAVGIAVLHMLVRGFGGAGWSFGAPLAATGGVLLGALIHPHFPNNFVMWWLQNVYVLQQAWASEANPLRLGGEFSPASTRDYVSQEALLVAVVVGLLLAVPRYAQRLRVEHATLFLLAIGFGFATAMSRRFNEYFAPFAVWCIAEVFTLWWQSGALRRWVLASAMVIAAVAFSLWNLPRLRAEIASKPANTTTPAGVWLLQHVPPGETVFTCDWDDAPELFFVNHLVHYLVFLDPMFMHFWQPTLWLEWQRVANGASDDPVRVLREAFGTRFGFCSDDFRPFLNQLAHDPRAQLTVLPGGVVFELSAQAASPASAPAK